MFIKLYCAHYEIETGKVELACNYLSAVTKGLRNKSRPKVSEQSHDLLLSIFELHTSSTITLEFCIFTDIKMQKIVHLINGNNSTVNAI